MRTSTRAFSLIEVLVSVLVLALGLLGLAAVFPAVLSQQKDVVLSRTADSAKSSIRELFSRASSLSSENSLVNLNLLALDSFISASGVPQCPEEVEYSGQWEVDWVWNRLPNVVGDEYFDLGTIRLGGGTYRTCIDDNADGVAESQVLQTIPVTVLRSMARMYPQPYSGLQPEYIWDLVPRKRKDGTLQVAVFVRRIDPAISIPGGSTLSEVLVGQIDVDQQTVSVFPVAEDPTTGVPSGNGRGVYSAIRSAPLTIVQTGSVTLAAVSRGDDSVNQLARVGQKFIDNLGDQPTVQTIVAREVVDNQVILTLSPGYSSELVDVDLDVLYTPQLAVDAFVETVR